MAALPDPAPGPRLLPNHDRPKPSKPDPRPMRAALGLGGIAAMSAIAAGIVSPPRPQAILLTAPAAAVPNPTSAGAASPTTDPANAAVGDPGASPTRRVIYIQLKPGETAPPGATVVAASAGPSLAVKLNGGVANPASGGQVSATPKPVPAATPKPAPQPTPIIIKTTQSGKVVP